MYIGIYLPVPELELEGRNISTGSGLNQWKALEDKKKGDNPVTQFHDEVVVKDKDRLEMFF